MATDTAKVLETLGSMTVLELVELKKAIEEEWGVTAAAPVAVAAAPGAPAAGDGGAMAFGLVTKGTLHEGYRLHLIRGGNTQRECVCKAIAGTSKRLPQARPRVRRQPPRARQAIQHF